MLCRHFRRHPYSREVKDTRGMLQRLSVRFTVNETLRSIGVKENDRAARTLTELGRP
jgi:hypothetical protein